MKKRKIIRLIGGCLLILVAAVLIVVGIGREKVLGRTFYVVRGEKRIYGKLFLPAGKRKDVPLVILGHGYGGSYSDNLDYGRSLSEKGIGFYCFDFCGGSPESKSTGRQQDMSVQTEMEDLEDILDEMLGQSWVDKEGIFLGGKSLGGGVATLVGAKRKDDVAGLILHYPYLFTSRAFRQREESGESKESENEETLEEILSYAIAEDIPGKLSGFEKRVLIFNGDKDKYVPLAYTQIVEGLFPQAELIVLKGSGHGFKGEARDLVKEEMTAFVREVAGPALRLENRRSGSLWIEDEGTETREDRTGESKRKSPGERMSRETGRR